MFLWKEKYIFPVTLHISSQNQWFWHRNSVVIKKWEAKRGRKSNPKKRFERKPLWKLTWIKIACSFFMTLLTHTFFVSISPLRHKSGLQNCRENKSVNYVNRSRPTVLKGKVVSRLLFLCFFISFWKQNRFFPTIFLCCVVLSCCRVSPTSNKFYINFWVLCGWT